MAPSHCATVRPAARGDPLELAGPPHGFRKLSVSSFTSARSAMPSMKSTNMICMQVYLFLRTSEEPWRADIDRATSSPTAHTLGAVAGRPAASAATIARFLSSRLWSTLPLTKGAPAVHACTQLHMHCLHDLELLLTPPMCCGDGLHAWARLRAHPPALIAPDARISLAGCAIDGKRQALRQAATGDEEGRRWLLQRTQVAAPVHGVGICVVSRLARTVRRRDMPRHVTLAVDGQPDGYSQVVVRGVCGRDVERRA